MHKDEAKGAGKETRGHIKDAVGKATGDEKLQAEGKMDKAGGKVKSAVGGIADTIRDKTDGNPRT